MKVVVSILSILAIMTFGYSCKNAKKSTENKSNIHTVVVKEAIQAGEYTYIRVTEGDDEKWLAAPACIPLVGTTYYYKGGMEMKDFKSKELNRTFASVYFIDNISSVPISDTTATPTNNANQADPNAMAQHIAKTTSEKVDVKITPLAGGVTIGEVV